MASIRLRHPNGVATIRAALDRDDFTVLDLQQEIFSATQIIPSRQRCAWRSPPILRSPTDSMHDLSESRLPAARPDANPRAAGI